MNSKTKSLVRQVRATASGRWVEILNAVCNLPIEVLDSQHHPCPICIEAGRDRFRAFNDVDETGGLMCDHCIGRCHDGFEVIKRVKQVTFAGAVQLIADYLGLLARKGR